MECTISPFGQNLIVLMGRQAAHQLFFLRVPAKTGAPKIFQQSTLIGRLVVWLGGEYNRNSRFITTFADQPDVFQKLGNGGCLPIEKIQKILLHVVNQQDGTFGSESPLDPIF